ncbi:MAG: carboxypeptidase Taq [Clostridiales bacterium]|nr:carboxypeptidase Taq [Clostridiales bacterium]
MNQLFEELEEKYLKKGQAVFAALTLFEWDQTTEAPEAADENTAKYVGSLSDLYFSLYINDEVRGYMEKLNQQTDQIGERERAILRELGRLYEKLETIPKDEYSAYSELTATSVNIWAKAKENADFSAFMPTLEKIVAYKKRFARYRDPEQKKLAYDVLLSDYESGFDHVALDAFFSLIKKELPPMIKTITEKTKDMVDPLAGKTFDVEKQKEFSHFLAEYIGFDFTSGVMKESAHPFTTNFHNKDVRITNHYYEDNLISAIFSIIHEGGHGIYEMQIADELTQSLVGEGSSMGLHESQSRFYENVIGRSKEFWEPIYPKLLETFKEQLSDVSLDDFIKVINRPKCSLIRTEADELTYSLHVLIRYEVESLLFEDKISVADIPSVWNKKYQEYLFVTPENDKVGALQDVHWACGDFGYFPSYALGSAVAAQIYFYMKEHTTLFDHIKDGELQPIKAYLGEWIHRFGKTKNTNEILLNMTGEAFEPKYYIQYLKEKYTKIYGIDFE